MKDATQDKSHAEIYASAESFFVSKIKLTNFRSYESLSLNLDSRSVVLTGQNGAGKTNILEAVSLLSPGRGLRGVKLEQISRYKNGLQLPWGVASTVNQSYRECEIATGIDSIVSSKKRVIKIDGDVIKNQGQLAEVFSVMWLTPQMDGLFIGSSSDRRKFMDRLVYNFDTEHASRVYSYEYSTRERAKLLQNNGDSSWISVLEAKMAERAVAIAAARLDTIENIQSSIFTAPSAFPKAIIAAEGGVEELVKQNSALAAEEIMRENLFNNRAEDARSGRTNFGTHRSDLVAIHHEKSMPAESCSTGEQKALLLSIILAEARAKALWKNNIPVLLLDEVVAHLDEYRRAALFEEILAMRAQAWMTGTDNILFEAMSDKANCLKVG